MGVGGGQGGALPSLYFENFIKIKKVVFLVLSGKKQISPLLTPLEKIWNNSLLSPPGKNPSDTHDCSVRLINRAYRS